MNYGLLTPERYPFVCESSYLRLLEFFKKRYAGAKWTLEMSGFTLDTICRLYPEAGRMLRDAYAQDCEAAASPYSHSILSLFPREHAYQSLDFSMQSWKRQLQHTPQIGWIPECAWSEGLPHVYREHGLCTLMADYDSLVQTRENKRVPRSYCRKPGMIDRHLSVDPADPDLHTAPALPGGGRAVLRSDRVVMRTLKYLQNDYSFADLKATIEKYSQGEGYLVVYACDTEYLGTTAWFNLREEGADSVFQACPESFDRLARLLDYLDTRGNLLTISEAAAKYPAADGRELKIENGLAWHHGHVSQWETTPQSKYMNKRCTMVGEKLMQAQARSHVNQDRLKQAWWNLVQAESSDNGYPLPPLQPGEYNFQFCAGHLEEAASIAEQLLAENFTEVKIEKSLLKSDNLY